MAINGVLRWLGVHRGEAVDEFQAVALARIPDRHLSPLGRTHVDAHQATDDQQRPGRGTLLIDRAARRVIAAIPAASSCSTSSDDNPPRKLPAIAAATSASATNQGSGTRPPNGNTESHRTPPASVPTVGHSVGRPAAITTRIRLPHADGRGLSWIAAEPTGSLPCRGQLDLLRYEGRPHRPAVGGHPRGRIASTSSYDEVSAGVPSRYRHPAGLGLCVRT